MSLPGENTEANFIMKIIANQKIKKDSPVKMFFKISQGIKLDIEGKNI